MTVREKIRYEMAKLDWIKILDQAIKNRQTSWYGGNHTVASLDGSFVPPVREWRNASDEIWCEVVKAMEEAKIIPPMWKPKK